MECREVREYLPAYVDQMGGPRSVEVEAHLLSCGDCPIELDQYRQMEAQLGVLAEQNVEPPPWLLGTLVETVGERAQRLEAIRAKMRNVADPKVIATGGALVAAGIAGAIVMMSRRRRRRGIAQRLREAVAEA